MAININAKTSGVGGLETTADNSGNINIQSGGSTVMSVTSSGVAVTGSFSQNGAVYSTQPTFRNLIINGDMRIAQRGTSATGLTNGSTGYYTVDRFQFVESGSPTSAWTMSQDTDVPTGQGFANSLKMDCTTAQASLGTGDTLYLFHKIEGQHLQHLNFGTSSAESLTLSFWVKSNKTGTYIAELYQTDATRAVSYAYTVSSADTWEKKTITYVGDTSGQIDNDNGTGLQIAFWLATGTDRSSGTLATSWASVNNPDRGVGQVNLADSTSNYINITAVQLEVGTEATPFEHRPYDMELARCQRYYQIIKGGVAIAQSSTGLLGNFALFLPMRATPSIGKTSTTFSFGDMVSAGYTTSGSPARGGYANDNLRVNYSLAGFTGLVAYRSYQHEPNGGNNALFTSDAEL